VGAVLIVLIKLKLPSVDIVASPILTPNASVEFTISGENLQPHLVLIHRLKNVAQHLAVKVRLRTEEPLKLLRKTRHAIAMEREKSAKPRFAYGKLVVFVSIEMRV
jgi:hypothetical protein